MAALPLTRLHPAPPHAQREASLHQRRGGPHPVSAGTGRKAKLTLADPT